MPREELQRWILIGLLAWVALALSLCHGARIEVQPAPVKVLPVVSAPADAHRNAPVVVRETTSQQISAWVSIASSVVQAAVPVAVLIAGAWAVRAFLPPLWGAVQVLFGKDRPAPLAEGGLTVFGALAAGYAAIKPDLEEHGFIVILITAFGLLTPLFLSYIRSLWWRIGAFVAAAAGLIGLPAIIIGVWPFFVKEGKDKVFTHINGLEAVVEQLHEIKPESLAVLSLLAATFVIKVVLAIAKPNTDAT